MIIPVNGVRVRTIVLYKVRPKSKCTKFLVHEMATLRHYTYFIAAHLLDSSPQVQTGLNLISSVIASLLLFVPYDHVLVLHYVFNGSKYRTAVRELRLKRLKA